MTLVDIVAALPISSSRSFTSKLKSINCASVSAASPAERATSEKDDSLPTESFKLSRYADPETADLRLMNSLLMKMA